jgi:tetratricopeptide (TPR) repeat protein
LSRLFISHSSRDNVAAVAFKQWLGAIGWPNDHVFLDLDSIGAGERWKEALNKANARCEAVILLASLDALSSAECIAEVRKAEDVGKEIVVVLLRDLQIEDNRLGAFKDRQIVDLAAPPQSHVETVDYRGEHHEVRFNATGLARVRDFLEKRGITPDRFAWPPPDKPNAEPFPGLSAFTEGDAGIFFGRDADIVRGLDRLRILRRNDLPRLLVIQAASGAGKSSYLRAGLWQRLKRDADFAPLAILRPAQGILTGPEGLGRKLAALLSRPAQPVSSGEIHAQFTAPDANQAVANFNKHVAAAAAQALERRRIGDDESRPPALVIAVDQAEELFGADDKAESDRFLHLLASFLREPPADVELFCLFTIRSDGAARLFQTLADLDLEIPETLPLLPLPQTAYRDVIVKPLEVLARGGRRLTLAPALANRLVEDATGGDALPLLAFTISHLYREFAATGSLTLEQYDSIGGIAGSIDMALKQALARPGDAPAIPAMREDQFALLRATFIPWLARVDPHTGEPMRRVAHLDEFASTARAMVERLIEARLLVTDRRSGADVVEVAHESLLRQWPALTAWLEADADDLKVVDAIEHAAREWARNGKSDSWLDHRDERLAAAERVAARADFRNRLGQLSIAYIATCRAKQEAESRRLAQRRKILISSLTAAIIVFACIAGFSIVSWRMAQKNLAAARGAISTLVETISETVQPIAQLDQVQSLIDQARQTMNTFATITKDPDVVLQNARTLLILADIDWDRGLIGHMKDDAEGALADVAPLAAAGNLEARNQRARAFRFIGLADWEANKNEEARDLYRQGIHDLERMLTEHPGDPNVWQWETSIADLHQELGDVLLFRLGDSDDALAAFETCHAERLRVRELGHGGPGIDEAIAWAENKFGDVQWRLGNVDGALKWFSTARDSFNGLGDHLWDNLRWPHRLALIYNNIGLEHNRRGQFREAEAAFDSAQALLTDVIKRDPHNLFRASALPWTLDNQGETLVRLALQTNDQEPLNKARRILSMALEMRQKHAMTAPDKVDFQLAVIDTQANIASAAAATKQLSGDHAAAAKEFQSAAGLLLRGYGTPGWREAPLVRTIDYLELSAQEFSRASQSDSSRGVLKQALELADANKPMLGNFYVDLTSRLQKQLEAAPRPL